MGQNAKFLLQKMVCFVPEGAIFFPKIVRSLFAIFLPFVLLIAVVRFEDVITVDTGVCLAACVMMSVILECLVIVTIILVTPVPRP